MGATWWAWTFSLIPKSLLTRKSMPRFWGDIFSLWNLEDVPRGGSAGSLQKLRHAQRSRFLQLNKEGLSEMQTVWLKNAGRGPEFAPYWKGRDLVGTKWRDTGEPHGQCKGEGECMCDGRAGESCKNEVSFELGQNVDKQRCGMGVTG